MGIRVIFIKCSNNVEYLMWFQSFLAKRGYCSHNKLKLSKLIGKGNKVFFTYILKSYSFSSFIWLFNLFYRDNIKKIPRNLNEYLTPLALATWLLSENVLGKKANLVTKYHVSKEDMKYISSILKNKYKIETVIKLKGRKLDNKHGYTGGSLYIKNSSISIFSKIVKPHILPSQHYILNRPFLKLSLPGSSGLDNYSTCSKKGISIKKDLSYVKYTVKYKTEYMLSLEQKEALIGIILGDGSLERNKSTYNTRLRLEQSYPEKEEYLKSLYDLMKDMTTMTSVVLTRKDKGSGSVYQSIYFRTLSMPCLNYYYNLFYKEKVKHIARNLNQLLTARGLAYWIIDDGGKSIYNQTILHTRAFILQDVKYIQSVLFENFGLITRIEEKKKRSMSHIYTS